MAAAKKMLGCPSTTSNAVLREELGMYPLETSRDVRKLKCQYKVQNTPEKRLPAILERAVWKKITKGRAEIKWDNVVEKIWKGLGGGQEELPGTVYREVWRVQARIKIKNRRKGKASAKK